MSQGGSGNGFQHCGDSDDEVRHIHEADAPDETDTFDEIDALLGSEGEPAKQELLEDQIHQHTVNQIYAEAEAYMRAQQRRKEVHAAQARANQMKLQCMSVGLCQKVYHGPRGQCFQPTSRGKRYCSLHAYEDKKLKDRKQREREAKASTSQKRPQQRQSVKAHKPTNPSTPRGKNKTPLHIKRSKHVEVLSESDLEVCEARSKPRRAKGNERVANDHPNEIETDEAAAASVSAVATPEAFVPSAVPVVVESQPGNTEDMSFADRHLDQLMADMDVTKDEMEE